MLCYILCYILYVTHDFSPWCNEVVEFHCSFFVFFMLNYNKGLERRTLLPGSCPWGMKDDAPGDPRPHSILQPPDTGLGPSRYRLGSEIRNRSTSGSRGAGLIRKQQKHCKTPGALQRFPVIRRQKRGGWWLVQAWCT